MRTKDELFSSALVEIFVTLGSLFQGNDGSVDCLGDLHLVVKNRIHQLSMVAQPKLRACASRSLFISPTMTTAAPSKCADAAHAKPTGPPPATYTVDPVVTPAVKAPW